MNVQCPQCARAVSVADEFAGQRVRCPHCQREFLAPGVTATTTDDDDWLALDQPVIPAVTPPLPTKAPPLPTKTKGNPPTKASKSSAGVSDSARRGEPESVDDSFFTDLPPEPDDFTTTMETPPLPVPPRGPQPDEAMSVEYATEYRVRCKTCDSIMFAKASQSGKTVKCTDCHSPITIPPPPKVRKPKTIEIDSAPTFTFSDSPSVRRPETDPFRKSAEQLLDEAERDQDEEVKPISYADTPQVREWLAGVFGIFRDLSVVTHWVGLSLMASVPIVFVMAVNKPFFYTLMVPVGLFFAAIVVSCGFAILQSVANGEPSVSEWPIFDPPSWLGELVVVVAATGLVAAPAFAITQMFNAGLVGIAITMLSIYGLFPFVLLSMMDMNSIFQPFSPEVARSVSKCEEAWGGFYFSAGLMFAALFFVFFVGRTLGVIGVVVSVFAAIAVVFIYFAMIGRLAYAIGQAVNEPPRRRERTDNPVDEPTDP